MNGLSRQKESVKMLTNLDSTILVFAYGDLQSKFSGKVEP